MPELALVMIARNESRAIERALRSAAPFVDQLIVLDTGSTDGTETIARECGAQVHRFAWTDDFSAARNAALAYSAARCNLVLDADEWVGQAEGNVLREAIEAARGPFIGLLPVVSEFDLQGRVESANSWLPRLLPRGVVYQGRIHEQPVSGLARRQVALPVLHDGYRRAILEQKKGRNQALLLRALQDRPFDPYFLYQLGKDYEVYEDYGNAVQRFRQALQFSGPADPFRHELVVRTLYALKKAQLHEEAIGLAELEMNNWPQSPDFYFAVGDLLLDWAALNPDRADELLPIVESSWLKCLEIGEQPGLAGSVNGRGSHLAAHNLAVLYDGVGDTDRAARYRQLAAVRQPA